MDTSALMIYQDKGVADQIVGKLAARHPGVKWTVKQTPLGFQIFRVGKAFNPVVTPVNSAATLVSPPSAQPLGLDDGGNFVKAAEALLQSQSAPVPTITAEVLKQAVTAIKKHKNAALDAPVFVTLPYVKMTPEFIEVKDGGKHQWVQKSSVKSWELIDENVEPILIKITMPLWYAQKRKFAYDQI